MRRLLAGRARREPARADPRRAKPLKASASRPLPHPFGSSRQLASRPVAALAGLAALAGAAALAAPAATSCSFSGARWQLDGLTGTTYEVKGLRGVTCAQAITLARPLTRKRSNGPQTRVPAPRGWLCLSYSPRGSKVARGACAKLGKRVVWGPGDGKPVGGGGPKNPPGGGKPSLRRP